MAQDDHTLSAYNYSPPGVAASNIDQQVSAALEARLKALGVNIPLPAPELPPEQAARVKVDRAGLGLGVEERLAEVYSLLDLLLRKAGL